MLNLGFDTGLLLARQVLLFPDLFTGALDFVHLLHDHFELLLCSLLELANGLVPKVAQVLQFALQALYLFLSSRYDFGHSSAVHMMYR